MACIFDLTFLISSDYPQFNHNLTIARLCVLLWVSNKKYVCFLRFPCNAFIAPKMTVVLGDIYYYQFCWKKSSRAIVMRPTRF